MSHLTLNENWAKIPLWNSRSDETSVFLILLKFKTEPGFFESFVEFHKHFCITKHSFMESCPSLWFQMDTAEKFWIFTRFGETWWLWELSLLLFFYVSKEKMNNFMDYVDCNLKPGWVEREKSFDPSKWTSANYLLSTNFMRE